MKSLRTCLADATICLRLYGYGLDEADKRARELAVELFDSLPDSNPWKKGFKPDEEDMDLLSVLGIADIVDSGGQSGHFAGGDGRGDGAGGGSTDSATSGAASRGASWRAPGCCPRR